MATMIIEPFKENENVVGITQKALFWQNDNDLVRVEAISAKASAKAVESSTLDLGGGDDAVILSAAALTDSNAHGMQLTTLALGEGSNIAEISAYSNGGEVRGMDSSLLLGGSSHTDDILVSASSKANGAAIGVHASTVYLNGGYNELKVFSFAENNTAAGVWNGKIYGSGGNAQNADSISIAAYCSGRGTAVGVGGNSFINMQNGIHNLAASASAADGNATAFDGSALIGYDLPVVDYTSHITFAARTGNVNGIAKGLNSSAVTLNDGAHAASISAISEGGHALAMDHSTFACGNGADALALRVASYGNGTSVAMGNSTLDMKNGENSLIIEALTTDNTSSGLWDSNIFGGSGADAIGIYATADGAGHARGIDRSVIYAGNGDNYISLLSTSKGWDSYAVGGEVIGGMDNDGFVIGAITEGTGIAGALRYGIVDMGSGSNTLHLFATAVDGHAYGAGSAVYGGSGVDALAISAMASGKGTATAVASGAAIDGMAGDDRIEVTAWVQGSGDALGLDSNAMLQGNHGNDQIVLTAYSAMGNACAVSGHINSGEGDDVIRVTACSDNAQVLASTLQGGGIYGLSGNDDITLSTNGVLSAHKAASVYGGSENDIVRLVHTNPGAAKDFTQGDATLIIEGESNYSVFHSSANGGRASLGDILALEQGYADTAMLGKLSQLTVKGFEGLVLDFSNGLDDGASLDALLGAVKSLRATNTDLSLIIKGDEGVDTVMAGGLLQNLKHSDVSVDGLSHDAHGNSITYSHYTADYQDSIIDVYLQSGIGIA